MKRIGRLIGIFFILAALLIAQIPVKSADASGAQDFRTQGTTLVAYVGNSADVQVPSGIEEIGKSAFENNDSIKSVTLPNTVKFIKSYAFWDCDSLKNVTLGSGLMEVGDCSFMNCTGLESMTLPSNIKFIGVRAFENCPLLKTLYIPPQTVRIHETAFDGDYNLTLLYEEGSYAEKYALNYYANREDKAEYEDLSGILGRDSNRENNKDSGNESGVNDGSQTGNNGDEKESSSDAGSLNNNYSLDVEDALGTDSNSERRESDRDSSDSDSETDSNYHGDNKTETGLETDNGNRDETGTANGDETEKDSGNRNGSNGNADLDNSDENNDENSDVNNSGDGNTDGNLLGQVNVVANSAVVIMDNNDMNVYSGAGLYPKLDENAAVTLTSEEKNDSGLVESTLPYEKRVAEHAYYMDNSMESVIVPDGIEALGEFCFARSALKNAFLPDSLENIEYGAFYHCDDLYDIKLGDNIKCISPKAFDKTALTNDFYTYYEPESVGRKADFLIKNDCLLAYRGITDTVEIPEGVRVIAGEAFKDHSEIKSITCPESLMYIGEGAFSGCTGLGFVDMGENVVSVLDRAFYDCPISMVEMGTGFNNMGVNAFNPNTQVITKSSYNKTVEPSTRRLSNSEYRNVEKGENLSERVKVKNTPGYAILSKAVNEHTLDVDKLDSSYFEGTFLANGMALPINNMCYELNLFDESGISIDRLGKSRLHLALPLQEGINDPVCFYTDGDGQLKQAGCFVTSYKDKPFVQMELPYVSRIIIADKSGLTPASSEEEITVSEENVEMQMSVFPVDKEINLKLGTVTARCFKFAGSLMSLFIGLLMVIRKKE
ncbi:MAG: leucine-rich repeat protein [Lachnospiraceae bacterium]|nr:leucine-rich repeat protein [Lachnospiraceae bacterium]